MLGGVSIQLVSPTSGELTFTISNEAPKGKAKSFHSISFPNEWGVYSRLPTYAEKYRGFDRLSEALVSIQLVSPTSGE
jgi:hypothetical protein